MAEINVVPYIDVMLVLLIIFMITAPLIQQGVEIDLPKAAAEPLKDETSDPLIVTVNKSGQYFLDIGDNSGKPVDAETMQELVSTVLSNKPETPIMIRGDRNVLYGEIVKAMVTLQNAGAPSVGLVTEPAN
ncbi:MAG: protein TolR [Cycloclasticus sp. symbiont of Poecilosclerida sp. M]|nr:MAG: protein TolR [Cycloclasticus sp. symbiont of Poecilosclerida sp. M]